MGWIGWLIVGLVLGIIEMLTVDFTFLMLAGGAVAAAVAAGFTDSWTIQVIVFVVVSILLLFTVRPWARRHVANSTPETRTNTEALLGRPAEALCDISERGGRVKLDGEVWSARTTGTVAPQGAVVRVAVIDGATVIVEPE